MYRFKQLLLLGGDLIALYLGLYAAVVLREAWRIPELPGQQFFDLLAPMSQLFLMAAVIAFVVGLYDVGRAKNSWVFYKKILITSSIWLSFGVLYFYLNPGLRLAPKTILLLTAGAGFGLLAIWRSFYNRFLSSSVLKTRVVFVGDSPEARELILLFAKEPQRGYEIVGMITDGENNSTSLPVYTARNWEDLMRHIGSGPINIAVVSGAHLKNTALLCQL